MIFLLYVFIAFARLTVSELDPAVVQTLLSKVVVRTPI